MTKRKNNHWIQTVSGKAFDFQNPTKDMIDINDIAHALSKQCRFNGHTNKFYSVAEHCVLVSKLSIFETPYERLAALLHDSAEAYIGDVADPVKQNLPWFKETEKKILSVVWEALGFEPLSDELKDKIRNGDFQVFLNEKNQLMAEKDAQDWELPYAEYEVVEIEGMDHQRAYEQFMMRFYDLLYTVNGTYDRQLKAWGFMAPYLPLHVSKPIFDKKPENWLDEIMRLHQRVIDDLMDKGWIRLCTKENLDEGLKDTKYEHLIALLPQNY